MSDDRPLNVEWTSVFKRDYKRAMKRNLDITLLDDIIGGMCPNVGVGSSNGSAKRVKRISMRYARHLARFADHRTSSPPTRMKR